MCEEAVQDVTRHSSHFPCGTGKRNWSRIRWALTSWLQSRNSTWAASTIHQSGTRAQKCDSAVQQLTSLFGSLGSCLLLVLIIGVLPPLQRGGGRITPAHFNYQLHSIPQEPLGEGAAAQHHGAVLLQPVSASHAHQVHRKKLVFRKALGISGGPGPACLQVVAMRAGDVLGHWHVGHLPVLGGSSDPDSTCPYPVEEAEPVPFFRMYRFAAFHSLRSMFICRIPTT